MKDKMIDKWKILNQLKKGGQATIYDVEEGEGLPIRALKLIKTQNLKKRERFIQEIKKHVELSDKKVANIIPILDHNLDAFIDGEKCGYFVMPKAVTTLGDQISLTVHRIEFCIEIFKGILNGISEAHSIGIIHRDIKPFNVLFLDNSLKEPMVSDFGICFVKETQEHQRITEMNETVGAKFFMAPEQERGGIVDVDERADIYALGKLLHYMLTKRNLYRENLDEAFLIKEIDSDIRYKKILEYILSRTITLDKNERFNSVIELLDEINNIHNVPLIQNKSVEIELPIKISETNIKELNLIDTYKLFLNDITGNNLKTLKLIIGEFKKEFNEEWLSIRTEIDQNPKIAEDTAKKLVETNKKMVILSFAIIRFDSIELFDDLKELITNILISNKDLTGYVSVNAVPQALAGFLYMSATVAALNFKSWDFLKKLLNTKFEWYYQSGRSIYTYGFNTSYFFHSEAFGREANKIHDLFHLQLSNSEYLSILNIKQEDLLNIYLQTQFLMCIRGSQERQKGNDASMWAYFGKFHGLRVVNMLYKIKNEEDFAIGITMAFDENPTEWLNQLKERIKIIKKEFFGRGSGYWWHSIENDEINELFS
ncbi:MAG: serine/threonine-protein kinase [Candidatus Anammoxibacter sp.]